MESVNKLVKPGSVKLLLWMLWGCLSLTAAGEEKSDPLANEEISPQELKACEALLFKTKYLKEKLAWLEQRKVRWFFMNYKREGLVFFEFRDHREDMPHYPFICRLAVNPKTKECFVQENDLERIH